MKQSIRTAGWAVLAVYLATALTISASAAEPNHLNTIAVSTNSPQPTLSWKALWVEATGLQALSKIELVVEQAKTMGFNVIIARPNSKLLSAAHEQGLQFYAWVSCLRGLAPSDFYSEHANYLQRITMDEEFQMRSDRDNPQRDNIQTGPWLCPDFGLLEVERTALEKLLRADPLDGLLLDNVGYRNYYACFCEYSEIMRAAYAKRHPTASRGRVLQDFSEQALVRYVEQVSEVLKRIKPSLKLAIHINPDFDLNPLFGNKLAVDYCAETIAAGMPPFWSYDKIAARSKLFLAAQGIYQQNNHFVPFIAVLAGLDQKSPQRLQREIRLAAAAGTGNIMIAFYEALAENSDLAAVVAQELK